MSNRHYLEDENGNVVEMPQYNINSMDKFCMWFDTHFTIYLILQVSTIILFTYVFIKYYVPVI